MHTARRLLYHRLSENKTLLINSLSGRADIVSPRLLTYLKQPAKNSRIIGGKTQEQLLAAKYVLPDKKEEELLFTQLRSLAIRDAGLNPAPEFVILTNFSCNFTCPYCYEDRRVKKQAATMAGNKLRHCFKTLLAIKKYFQRRNGVKPRLDITLLGGEPLLPGNRGCLEQILKESRRIGARVLIVSNGYYLGEFLPLIKKYIKQIGYLQVTLDGPKKVHDQRRKLFSGRGTFDRIVQGLDQLKQLPINTVIRINLDRNNIGQLAKLLLFIKKKGWHRSKYFSFTPAAVTNISGACNHYKGLMPLPELLKKVLPLTKLSDPNGLLELPPNPVLANLAKYLGQLPAKKKGKIPPQIWRCHCNALQSFVFGPDGYIYPCSGAVGNKATAIGKYYPKFDLFPGRSTLWSGSIRSIGTIPKCRKCRIAMLCGGECALAALTHNGSLNEPVCNHGPAITKLVLDHFRKRLAKLPYTIRS